MPFSITFIFLGYVLVYASVANHGMFATAPWTGLFEDAYDVPVAPPSAGQGGTSGGTNPGSFTTPSTPAAPGTFNVPHGRLSQNEVAALARAEGAPANVASWIAGTSQPESGGDPNAVNSKSGATGLLQVLPSAWPQLARGGNLKDPAYNIRAALYILSVQGSSAWSGSGTWRGPAIPAGRYHFPLPKPSVQPLRNRHVVGRAA